MRSKMVVGFGCVFDRGNRRVVDPFPITRAPLHRFALDFLLQILLKNAVGACASRLECLKLHAMGGRHAGMLDFLCRLICRLPFAQAFGTTAH